MRVHDIKHQGHLIDKNFIIRLLYKAIYCLSSILYLHLPLLVLLTALCQLLTEKMMMNIKH